jgi:hypothetical protein
VEEAESFVLDWRVGESEDECDVDLAVDPTTDPLNELDPVAASKRDRRWLTDGCE